MNVFPILAVLFAAFSIVPLTIFIALVALPRDRAMRAALGLVGAVLAYLLLARLLMLPPFSGEPGNDGTLRVALFLWTVPLVLAMMLQALRPILRVRRVLYPLFAATLGLLVGLPTLAMFF